MKNGKWLMIAIVILGWGSVILQFYLIITHRVASIPETIVRFFSFFTILTNTLTALCFTIVKDEKPSGLYRFFSDTKTLTAITIYMTIVGLVYNVILRSIWQPTGLQLLVDESLHVIMPLLTIMYWILYVPKHQLRYQNILPWMVYPLIYFIIVIIRGAMSGFYPYPFIHVGQLGYSKVAVNAILVMLVFVVVAILFVGMDRLMKSNQVTLKQ